MKVLAVGNSFLRDATDFLYDMLAEAGVEEIVEGNVFKSGCTIETHYDMAQTGEAAYTYTKFTSEVICDSKNFTVIKSNSHPIKNDG